MSELTGCRACRHYSAGIMGMLAHRWGHKCNYHGKDQPRLIRWPVEGTRQPLDIPEWCPKEAGHD